MENQTPNAKKPPWEEVDSEVISAFSYDENHHILEIKFKNTDVYRYLDVPVDVVNGLRQASSKESYLQSMIINVYPYQKGRTRR